MSDTVFIGHSNMQAFDYWWEEHLPSWIIICCRQGRARISLQFRKYDLSPDVLFFISPDLYPTISEMSPDLDVLYILGTNDYMNDVLFGMPSEFFMAVYQHPFLQADDLFKRLFDLIERLDAEQDNPFREQILTDQLHAFALRYFHALRQQFGDTFTHQGSPSEVLCGKFYDLVMKECREHREVSFFADKLCISSNYLSMILHSHCNESPKQAIARQVISEIKYLLIHSDSNISAIARDLHFPDASYMCRYFKKETQVALTAYRKQLKRVPDDHQRERSAADADGSAE